MGCEMMVVMLMVYIHSNGHGRSLSAHYELSKKNCVGRAHSLADGGYLVIAASPRIVAHLF